jgi:hypothetical protein
MTISFSINKLSETRVASTTTEGGVRMFQDGKNLWTRKEYLTEIMCSKFVDLAAPDMMSEAHDELDESVDESESIDPFTRFKRRLVTHYGKLKKAVMHLLTLSPSSFAPLEKDLFGFRKLLVVGTRHGMIVALDTTSGDVVWQRYLGVDGFVKKISLIRSSSVKYPPVIAIVSILPDVCSVW